MPDVTSAQPQDRLEIPMICLQAAGEKGGLAVALPEIEHLKVNYRVCTPLFYQTHACRIAIAPCLHVEV